MSNINSSADHLTLNADGTGKSIKFQCNNVEKASIDSSGNFTSTSIDATKLSGALPAIDGSALTGTFGVGQTWQSVTRAVATTYTNSTGRPIVVAIRGNVSATSVADLKLTVGGVPAWTRYTGHLVGDFNITAVIPKGATYIFTIPPYTTWDIWNELR